MADELHDISPKDRNAIARQIQKDQQRNPSATLPELYFYGDGDLQEAVKTNRDGSLEYTNYDDATGNQTSREVISQTGRERYERDPNTEKLTAVDIHNIDGS